MRTDYETCTLEKNGPVGVVTLTPPDALSDLHWDLAELLTGLRGDNSLRVIVVTGTGSSFYVPPRPELFSGDQLRGQNDPASLWRVFTGVLRIHHAMAEMEKLVARVNGDAIGFGSSLAFACDLIIAVESAVFSDAHLGMGEVEQGGPPYGVVPGDGGGALVPLFMSPVKAKEYLMLSTSPTAAELAGLGIINYAVPETELNAKVDMIVEALLRRSAYALAWTKRIANRNVVDALNQSLDASAAYEMVNFLQIEKLEWNDPKNLG